MGVLGSAFNPPHLGHAVLAQEAAWACRLERVLFVPTGVAPHKRIEDDPGAEVRVELTRLAVADEPQFEVFSDEVDRGGVSYMHETLERLAEARPGCELVLILGADAALGLDRWQRPERIVELAHLAVAGREGIDRSDLEAALGRLGDRVHYEFIAMPTVGISSSLVRERCAAGMPLRHLVADRVAQALAERSIYGGGGDRDGRTGA